MTVVGRQQQVQRPWGRVHGTRRPVWLEKVAGDSRPCRAEPGPLPCHLSPYPSIASPRCHLPHWLSQRFELLSPPFSPSPSHLTRCWAWKFPPAKPMRNLPPPLARHRLFSCPWLWPLPGCCPRPADRGIPLGLREITPVSSEPPVAPRGP